MLKNKLFLIIISIVTVVLLGTGYINFKTVNDLFNVQVQKDIGKDQKVLNQYFDKTQKNLLSLIDEISANEDLKSSLNLISLYEDPDNYVKETFDFEKNSLIELSNKWIKDSAHYSMALFDKDLKLILINRKLDEHQALGYVSYDEKGNRLFLDFQRKKPIETPFIDEVKLENLENFRLNFFIERFLISYLKAVKLDGEVIGYIKLTTCVDADGLKSINESLTQTTILKDQNDNYIFPSKKLQEKFEFFKKSNDIQFINSKVLDLENNLYSISIVDESILNDKRKNTIISILEIWIILLVIVLFISNYFIKRSILKPMSNLKNTIENIKQGRVLKKEKIQSKDEISQIVNEFNNLSIDLSKNLAFLESYELAMNESSIVTKSDLKGNITYVNDNFCKITGYSKKEALGKPHNIVRHKDNSKEIFKELWETIQNKQVWKGVLKNSGKLSDYWVDISVIPVLDENKNIVEYIAIRHDITTMIAQQETLDNLANTDTLTGLGNRYKLNNDIKNSTTPALAILNIDNFTQINDFYGHHVGDKVIKDVGEIITQKIEKTGYSLYHLQGDEYVVFMANSSKDQFLNRMNSLSKSLENTTVVYENDDISFNFSIGVSFENKQSILQSADMALEIAKKENKHLIIYNDTLSLNKQYENNIKWAKKIKEAIENDKFIPVFQPIVNNRNQSYEKFECLVRMEDEDRLISPYFFLEISKKTKHYTEITKIMIKKSFNTFKDKDIEFSINLTIEDILNNDIQTFIFLMLDLHKIGDKVVFEIVESESIENFEEVLAFIQDIKSYGCKIAIDDFGTGYSNFEYLVKLNADYIKIDGSLIKDIDTNKTSQIVVKNLVNFAKDLQMKTIAEFVENESVLEKINQLGIDYSQGYYFSEPKKEVDFSAEKKS